MQVTPGVRLTNRSSTVRRHMPTATEKSRRMALRRDAGNRKPTASKGPKPVGQYLVAHACFHCRKSFKVASREGASPACPQCAAPMVWMGRAFAAPPSRNAAQWRKLEKLVQAGIHFGRYRGYVAPSPPSRLTDVKRFLFENPNHPLKRRGA
jgi:hypothetical protein